MGRWRGGGRGLEGVGIRLRRCRPADAWQSGPPQIKLHLEHGDIWCGTKRNLVAVIPSMGIAHPVSQIALSAAAV